MIQLRLRTLTLLMLCPLGFGCGGGNSDLERPLSLLDNPVALDEQLVLVDQGGHRAFMLDVGGASPQAEARQVDLPRAPSSAVRRNGKNEALILCMGQRASTSEAAEPAMLAALTSSGGLRRYKLGNPFDTLVQSDDGKYAFMFKSMNGTTDRTLDNPNEAAIVDLDAPPGKTGNNGVTLRKLRSFGDSPLAAVFSPTMHILDEDRRLAVVLSKTNVTLIDLSHLDRQETTVQLSDPGGQAAQPTQLLFSLDTPEIFVRGAGSSDVFVFNLSARPSDDQTVAGEAPHNDFRPSIDQLGVGGSPSDMALYTSDQGTRLLVLEGDTQQAAVVDASTSQVTSVKLPGAASQIVLFDATSPHDGQVAKRALLYQPGAAELMFLDLADLEAKGSRNLEQLSLDAPILKLIPIPEEHLAIVIHNSGGVSLIDLAGRTVSPIRSTRPLQDAVFDPLQHKLWVAPIGDTYVGLLDLANGDTQEVLLDAQTQALVPMFSRGHVVILHQSAIGYATVLSSSDPKRETARSVRGFLIAGLLDRGP